MKKIFMFLLMACLVGGFANNANAQKKITLGKQQPAAEQSVNNNPFGQAQQINKNSGVQCGAIQTTPNTQPVQKPMELPQGTTTFQHQHGNSSGGSNAMGAASSSNSTIEKEVKDFVFNVDKFVEFKDDANQREPYEQEASRLERDLSAKSYRNELNADQKSRFEKAKEKFNKARKSVKTHDSQGDVKSITK